jgi:hypothetical protein
MADLAELQTAVSIYILSKQQVNVLTEGDSYRIIRRRNRLCHDKSPVPCFVRTALDFY